MKNSSDLPTSGEFKKSECEINSMSSLRCILGLAGTFFCLGCYQIDTRKSSSAENDTIHKLHALSRVIENLTDQGVELQHIRTFDELLNESVKRDVCSPDDAEALRKDGWGLPFELKSKKIDDGILFIELISTYQKKRHRLDVRIQGKIIIRNSVE